MTPILCKTGGGGKTVPGIFVMIERREKKPISGFGGKNLRAGEVPMKGGENQKQCSVLMVGDLTGRVFSSERPGKCFLLYI